MGRKIVKKFVEQGTFITTGERYNVHGERWDIENYEMINTDLNLYHCGEHSCDKGHYWGPGVRDHYLIHYIVSGKGTFKCGNKTYTLGPGNGFLICPDSVVYYEADLEDPWHYYWVGFNGLYAKKILHQAGMRYDMPIFFSDDFYFFTNIIEDMVAHNKFSFERDLYRIGKLCLFLSKLVQIAPKNNMGIYSNSIIEEYIKSSIEYISKNYHCDLSVNDLSAHLGINRKYLYTIFKKTLGQTPIEYIIKTKMDKACTLLENKFLTIQEVSASVGYKDQFTFSKQFKKIFKVSPSAYRHNYFNKLTISS